MKRLIELFCNAFPRLPQIHRERYLPTTTTSFLILENNQTFSNGTYYYLCSSGRDSPRRSDLDRLLSNDNVQESA